jgi:WD40 repeat protein
MVRNLAFSPDGTTLVSADWHGAHVWVAATGKHLRRFGDPRGRQFQDIAFSPGGRTVALSMSEGEIDVWDAATGRRLSTFRAGRFPSVKLSPDGKALAVLDHDEKDRQRLRLLDAATGRELQRFAGHRDRAHQFVFSPDGKALISAGDDRAIRFWDTATGKEVRRLDTGEPVLRVAVAPDGKALASVSATKSEHGNATMWLQGKEVVLWDLATGKETHRLRGHGQNGVSALAFSPDGRSLVSSDWRSTHWWDVATGREDARRRWRVGRVNTLAFSADSRLLALGGSDNVVRLWDVTTGKEALPAAGHRSPVRAAAVSPDGRLLATGDGDGGIRLWDAATGQERRQLPADASCVLSLAFAGAGRLLVSVGHADKAVRVWEAATGKELRQFPGTIAVVSPDGKGVVTGDERELRYVDSASGRELRRWPLPKEGAGPLAFSADGRGVFTVGADRTLRLWDVATGKQLRQFGAPRFPEDSLDRIYCVAFAPAGNLAAFGGQSGVITLTDPQTGAEVRRLTGPAEAVSALAFSADGRVLASGDWRGGRVRLWEVATGQPFRELTGHEGRIHALAFSADGQVLLTGSDDTTALVWDVTGRRTGAPVPAPTAQELDTLWADLGAEDARRGQQAVGSLVAAPRQALALLGQQLRPAAPPGAERLARLFADLESDDFEVRERAVAGLKRLGESAEPALRRAFATTRSPEVRERVKPLLADLERSAEWVRTLRALQALESVGTPEARRLLESLARGAPEARLTRGAKASLLRLSRRPTPKP